MADMRCRKCIYPKWTNLYRKINGGPQSKSKWNNGKIISRTIEIFRWIFFYQPSFSEAFIIMEANNCRNFKKKINKDYTYFNRDAGI